MGIFNDDDVWRVILGIVEDNRVVNLHTILFKFFGEQCRDIYSGHPKLKNREEFEGGLEKLKGKGGKKKTKKRVIKHTLKYLYEA